jgi:hypothetical protein
VIKYVFKDEPITIKGAKNADAQRIGEALTAISVEGGGHLSPAAVVDAARDRAHVLHPHFEWRDRIAAEQYRLDQARTLIRVIRVIDDQDEDQTPGIAFLSVKANGGHNYYTKSAVAASVQLQALVLQQAERDLQAWEKRYGEIQDICRSVRELRETIAERRRRLIGEDASPPVPN